MTDALAPLPDDQAFDVVPDDLMRDAGRGTEDITSDDVKPPRILICQAGSPYRKPDDPKQIPGLQELDMFNDLSGDNYGRGPLKFVVLKALPPKYIEFRDMEEGGGVIDFDVKASDPRTQFTTDDEGKRHKPVATMFRDFLVWLPERQEPAVLSMKGSQLKVAVQLNGKIKQPLRGDLVHPGLAGKIIQDPPAWARTFSLKTKMDKDATYSWGAYSLTQEGVTPTATRELCSQLATSFAKKNIIIEREAGDDSFDTATMDATKTEM